MALPTTPTVAVGQAIAAGAGPIDTARINRSPLSSFICLSYGWVGYGVLVSLFWFVSADILMGGGLGYFTLYTGITIGIEMER